MNRLAFSVFDLTLGMAYLQGGFFLSGLTYYWMLRLLLADADGHLPGSWSVWMLLTPVIYLTWLLWFLLQCVLELQVHRFWMMYRKAPRLSPAEGIHSFLVFYATVFLYLRMRFVYSLPMIEALTPLPLIRHLVFRTYAVCDRLGYRSLVLGRVYDPDITEVGEGAIVGSGASIIGHSLTVNPDGSRLLVTAPIRIGARSVVGGCAMVLPGVDIGDDAVIEPLSYVPPMTQIGNGEVWGGNPARFLRMRTSESCQPAAYGGTSNSLLPDSEETALRAIVARVLHRPVESIGPSLSSSDCSAWDSLAQLSLSLNLHQTFGVRLSSLESFQLHSMADLRSAIRRSSTSQGEKSKESIRPEIDAV